MRSSYDDVISMLMMTVGWLLVLSSGYRLGIRCTLLGMHVFVSSFGPTSCATGDYFDIFLDGPVTKFPFNIVDNPMYIGSTLNFFAEAVRSVALLLSE